MSDFHPFINRTWTGVLESRCHGCESLVASGRVNRPKLLPRTRKIPLNRPTRVRTPGAFATMDCTTIKKVDHRNHLRNALSSSNACQGRSSVCLLVFLVTIRYAHYQPASARATATVAIYSRNARARRIDRCGPPSVFDDAEFRLIF